MQCSDQITNLAAALAKAQGEMEGAAKDKENPHFRSKYADLGAVWDAIRLPLSKNGLSVSQWMRSSGDENHHAVEVETFLLHESGEWIRDTFAVPVSKVDAQGYGSACTYARRYSLMAAVGIAPVDDDANAAVGGALPQKRNGAKPEPRRESPKQEKHDAADPYLAAVEAINRCETAIAVEKVALQIAASTKLGADKTKALHHAAQRCAQPPLTQDPEIVRVHSAIKEMLGA